MREQEYEYFLVTWEDGTKSRVAVSAADLNAKRIPTIQYRETMARMIISERSKKAIAEIETAYD